MIKLRLSQAQWIIFVLVDAAGAEVAGLGSTFTLEITKNTVDFVAGTGTKGEISAGWYKYQLTAGETDTEGPLGIKVTGIGVVQQNLYYEVSGSVFDEPAGTYILSAAEAAIVLRCAEDDDNMLMLLPIIDASIKISTGRNWAEDTTIHPLAKESAKRRLVRWHEDPGGMVVNNLDLSIQAIDTQLEALARYYYIFEGSEGAGSIALSAAREGDTVVSLIGKVGASGDQSAKFESVITEAGYIQQTSSDDLSEKWYEVKLVPPQEM